MIRKSTFHIKILLVLLLAIIPSCQSPPPPLPTNVADEIKNIQVKTVNPQKTIGSTEEFPLPNCGGTGKLTQTLGTRYTVSKTIEIGTTVSVSGGGEVGVSEIAKVSLEAAIEAAYKQQYETANTRLDTIGMEAAPRTHVVYTIEWENQEFSSIVTFEFNKELVQTPYTFSMKVPKIIGSREEKCPDIDSATSPSPSVITQPRGTSERSIQIQERGKVLIGIRHEDMYPMIYFDKKESIYKGFEIDLATEIATRLFGERIIIEWVPLRPEERIPAVNNNQIDFLIRNTTHTLSREKEVLFTNNYFLDGERLLVRLSDGYTDIRELDGKTIVAPSEIFASNLKNAVAATGIDVNILVDENASSVFNDRKADALALDWSSFGLFIDNPVENYETYQAIGDLITREPLAILISLNEPEFRDEIDMILLEIISDSTWKGIYDDWYHDSPLPWSIEEMLSEPPVNR